MSDKISISRWTDTWGNTGVEIEIRNDKHELLYEGDMKLEFFAQAVTGQSLIPIERDTRIKLKFGVEQEGATK